MTINIKLKFTIKETELGGWAARCPNLPESVLVGEEVPDVLEGIQAKLNDAFKDATNIEGGITALVAEYTIIRRAEVPLTMFTQEPNEDLKKSIAELKKDGVTIELEDPRTDNLHKKTTSQRLKELLEEDDGEYRWHRVTELKAGCAICTGLLNGCQGNKDGEACNSYNARDNLSDTCETCSRYDKTKKYCRKHNAKVEPHDFSCHEYKGRR